MINPPPNRQKLQDDAGNVTPAWQIFFSSIFGLLTAMQLSGTTAQRPTTGLYVGRPYFDTTLGYQINFNGSAWVDGAGNIV